MHALQVLALQVICSFIFFLPIAALQQKNFTSFVRTECKFGVTYTNNVNSSTRHLYVITDTSQVSSRVPARVNVHSSEATLSNPVLVVVGKHQGVVSWQLPLVSMTAQSTEYSTVSRTLCPGGDSFSSISGRMPIDLLSSETVMVSISSGSERNVSFSFSSTLETDFYVYIQEKRRCTLSPSEPRYYAFEFPRDVNSVLLNLESTDDICMTVSIQDIKCPVFDLERNVQFEGLWMSVTRAGALLITRDMFPEGFLVVLIVRGLDDVCTGLRTLSPNKELLRMKDVTFSIQNTITRSEYVIATVSMFAFFFAFAMLHLVIHGAHFILRRKRTGNKSQEQDFHTVNQEEENVNRVTNLHRILTYKDLKENLRKKVNAGEVVFVSDMSRTKCRTLRRESQMFLWNVFIVIVFYSLPVVQLVLTYQKMHNSGNQDLCFYNFLCTRPLGDLTDFNNIYSNVGYVILGVLFMAVVWIRERAHLAIIRGNAGRDQEVGIPQQFGLYYALGAALISEGILSGCYHICPSSSNFQFDTSFMYVIAMLCILRLYQNRHPDIQASAYTTFAVLAAVIFVGMCGVLWGAPLFWSIFIPAQLLATLLLSVQVYYMRCWSLDRGTWSRVVSAYTPSNYKNVRLCLMPIYPDRMIMLIIANLVNLGIAIFGLVFHSRDFFATYMLIIFIVNFMLYLSFYFVMKLIHSEKLRAQPMLYLALAFITGCCSVFFFVRNVASWENTPAVSRTFNRPCGLLKFYDSHDVWHFLSAVSLFFTYMLLLTLDDDLKHVPRNKISVF